jgi:LuxR family maltose regulon positive regulatory protein
VFERAGYDGSLPDGSASVDSWRASVRAQLCSGGVARMRADAEVAVRTLARGSFNRPNASLQLAFSLWLAGEVDHADDLFADMAEEGLELGTHEAAALALGERDAIAIGRGGWVQAEELVDRALQIVRRSRMEEYPASALICAVAARVALRHERAQEPLARAQRLRTRLTYAVPHFLVQTRLELARANLAIADAGGAATCCARSRRSCADRRTSGCPLPRWGQLRASLKTLRAQAPGASTLTEAELRLLPYLATNLTFPEVGERL